jgi:hypothetical protein
MVMAQILDPLPSGKKKTLLCCYVNATSQIQIARITNIPSWYFERVVFPGQRLVFEAVAGALVEIHSGMMASAILSDTIPSERLAIESGEEEDDFEEAVPAAAIVVNPELIAVEHIQPLMSQNQTRSIQTELTSFSSLNVALV